MRTDQTLEQRDVRSKDIPVFDSSERQRTKVLRIVDAVPEPEPDCGEGTVKDFNREVMKKLDAADAKGKNRPAGLLKWQQDLDKRIFKAGGQATPEQLCELACIKATYRLTRRERSSLPLACGRKWSTDTAPAAVALAVCLKALKNYDPAKGELGGYLYRIAYREVRKAAWEMFGTGKDMGFTGRGKDKAPVLLSRDVTKTNDEGEAIESSVAIATATFDVVPDAIESASDLEVVNTVQFTEFQKVRGAGWGGDFVATQITNVASIGQEAIAAKLELQLANLSPEEQALLKRWKGIGDPADGEAMEELTINCLAVEYGISAEGMRKRLNKLLLKARLS